MEATTSAAQDDSAYDPKRSDPIPAMSPTKKKTHYSTGPKSGNESFSDTFSGFQGCSCVSISSYFHPEETRNYGGNSTKQESNCTEASGR
ncbi:hypothetical protein Ccrd_023731 [Cynara cardunculus var. scolymus]|uniref:Uncharacterized protein n=1 Tax=Cynara cardunculus var. scolymus TaxID=59895 RepID=A0A124SDU9_CYNCS|nr:hypothetical protein Ccrd_023731 [Cynara cardunculus var. scolymus]